MRALDRPACLLTIQRCLFNRRLGLKSGLYLLGRQKSHHSAGHLDLGRNNWRSRAFITSKEGKSIAKDLGEVTGLC